jgi:hypothetical protein
MHKSNLVACLVVLLTFSAPAFASGAPGGGAPGSTGAPGGGAPGVATSSGASANASGAGAAAEAGPQHGLGAEGEMTPEKLAEVKARIAKRMDAVIAEIQKRKACIEAAMTAEALHVCGGPPMGGPDRMRGAMPQGGPQPK